MGSVMCESGFGFESGFKAFLAGFGCGFKKIEVDSDSSCLDSDPDSDSRCPDSHITGWDVFRM